MIETLKACLMFLGVVALIMFIAVWAEVAVLMVMEIVYTYRENKETDIDNEA